MRLRQKMRKIWHDAFYRNASKKRVEFALRCKDVTYDIDLHQKPGSVMDVIRFQLHLSLCQACRNYYSASRALSKAIKVAPKENLINLEDINKSLLEKYGRRKKADSKR